MTLLATKIRPSSKRQAQKAKFYPTRRRKRKRKRKRRHLLRGRKLWPKHGRYKSENALSRAMHVSP